jgi:filamentous hemagglutinin family protein
VAEASPLNLKDSRMRSPRTFVTSITLAMVLLAAPGAALANPKGGKVAKGSVAISSSGSVMTVTQRPTSLNRAIVNWSSFNVGSSETVNFVQPNEQSLLVNRVVGRCTSACHSTIDGVITANGNIMIINPNGILFGRGAKVDVNGLAATTVGLSDSELMNSAVPTSYLASADRGFVINEGSITARSGLVALVAPGVENNGTITARGGRVALASGRKFTLDFTGDGMVQLALSADAQTATGPTGPSGAMAAAVTNRGAIIADGGTVLLSARVAEGVLDKVINAGGLVQAQSVSTANGRIILHGGDSGWVQVTGTLDASGGAGTTGGSIDVLGEKVVLGDLSTANGQSLALAGGAVVTTAGGSVDGRIRIGGDEGMLPTDASGTGGVKLSTETIISAATSIIGTSSTTGYVVYREGTGRLLIDAVHGGSLKPSYIGTRDCSALSDCSMGTDLKTIELAQGIADAYTDLTGTSPHLVTVNLHRSKVDANRPNPTEDYTSIEGLKAWNATHDVLGLASAQIESAYGGRGLLIDVHGNVDPVRGVELGYVIPASVLNSYSDDQLNASNYASSSSIAALGRDSLSLGGVPNFARVLRGDLSLGTLLSQQTDYFGNPYYAPPGGLNGGPGSNHYFSGGYISQRYGSGGTSGGPTLDAIQVEVTADYRTQAAARNQLSLDLARSLQRFVLMNYGTGR